MVDGVVLCDSVSIGTGQQYGDYVEHGGHYEYWLNLAPTTVAESTFKAHAYDYFPRGRVVYDSQHRRVKLYADRCIKREAIAVIRELFALPSDMPIIYDEHYQCQSCNRAFIDDFDEAD
ncbi:MAG: hypothetical protein PHE17_21335 [Thiothrix sp.]|uniref:hypothetical protein n=1 Tax=Thiothrix sp. TaxID=1032 RepID=UPI002625CBAC|nr:hypothetical protein [Thiothrix sp.]MDD5395574.1 hypothetical protein [Thiothrix sp.]